MGVSSLTEGNQAMWSEKQRIEAQEWGAQENLRGQYDILGKRLLQHTGWVWVRLRLHFTMKEKRMFQ